MRDVRPDRRRVVSALSTVVLGAVAGCVGSNGDGGSDTPETEAGATEAPTPTADGTATERPSATQTEGPGSKLDLREANVVDVAFEADDGAYTFDVALHHDDDGEDGYANWWQVERLDGTRLGRRELLHAHSRQPFTRSTTVEIPDGVTCVVVRGHDQIHGYGGQLAVLNLETGESSYRAQGADPKPVAGGDCP